MTTPMELIWYNPDLDLYQKGNKRDLRTIMHSSLNQDRFSVLYQFNNNSQKLAKKILDSLNLVRDSRVTDGGI
ncbi:MAG: hypothetical protein AAGA85_20580 [Bacteroidota bacterium]